MLRLLVLGPPQGASDRLIKLVSEFPPILGVKKLAGLGVTLQVRYGRIRLSSTFVYTYAIDDLPERDLAVILDAGVFDAVLCDDEVVKNRNVLSLPDVSVLVVINEPKVSSPRYSKGGTHSVISLDLANPLAAREAFSLIESLLIRIR